MEKQRGEYKHGIKWHKRQVLYRELRKRARKSIKEFLEILKILGLSLLLLAEGYCAIVLIVILFG